jgi:putative inorganic carbon (hco3(-)) transporter
MGSNVPLRVTRNQQLSFLMLFSGLILFIFLQIIRPQDFVPGLIGTRLVLYLMTIILIALLFSPIEKKLFRSPQDKFAGIFFLSMVLSTLAQFWISDIIDVAIQTLKVAVTYYLFIIVIDSEVRFRRAVWSLVVLMAIVALMGVLQYHGYDVTGAGMKWSAFKSVWQIYGTGYFDNPNDLAYSTVLVVPFGLSLIFQAKSFTGRFGGLVITVISLYCIYLTRSRGGLIALAACLFSWAYFWIETPKRKKQMIVFALLGVFAVASVQVGDYREDASAMGRIEAWQEGWQMLKEHPIAGVGVEKFREYHSTDTHNSYVRAAAELGLLGLYSFVGMVSMVFFTIIRIAARPENKRWRFYYAGFGGFIVSYILASLFSTRTYDPILLMCIALVGILGRLSLKNSGEVSTEGVLFPKMTEHLWNRNIFGITIAILISWYLFLRQVW